MTENRTGPREAVSGVVEDVKGKAKEAAGVVSGKDRLEEEGQAQQAKAEQQRNVAKEEAEAERHRAAAAAEERVQRAAQRD